MIDVQKILEDNGGLQKFVGVAPEGFVLIHEKTLEDLKNFDTWTSWIQGKFLLKELDIKHFKDLS